MMFTKRGNSALLFLFSLFGSLLLFSSTQTTALAAPILEARANLVFDTDLEKRVNPIPAITEVVELVAGVVKFDKYVKVGMPPAGKSVFFTGQTRSDMNKIKRWATEKGLTHVGAIWQSPSFTDKGQYTGIEELVFKGFQKAFSKFYAEESSGTAYLVYPHGQMPKASGIFYSVELDAMIASGKIEKIIWVDQARIADEAYKWEEETLTYWVKGEAKPAAGT